MATYDFGLPPLGSGRQTNAAKEILRTLKKWGGWFLPEVTRDNQGNRVLRVNFRSSADKQDAIAHRYLLS